MIDAWSHAEEAAKKSDADAEKEVVYENVKGEQNPHTYTHAKDAAKKSDADAEIDPVYPLPPSSGGGATGPTSPSGPTGAAR